MTERPPQISSGVENDGCAEPIAAPTEGHVVRHPGAALYDAVFEMAVVAIPAIARRKNISLYNDEPAWLAQCALTDISRRTMRSFMNGDADSTRCIQGALDHALDVLAAATMIARLQLAEGVTLEDERILIAKGESAVAKRFANDQPPAFTVWPDPVMVASEYSRRRAEGITRPSARTLPGTPVSVTITPKSHHWKDIIRVATPGWDELVHD
jgi:hypothetical protein